MGHRHTKMTKNPYDELYKLLIIGDSNTGKSCLMNCFVGDEFDDVYIPTIGVDFKVRSVVLDGVKIKLQVWDTAGDPRFRTITRAYYRGSTGIIVTYSVTKKESFQNVPHWIEEAKRFGRPDVNLIVVGTGCDRREREVDYFTARDFADEQQLSFLEVSAKDSTNVELAFLTLTQEIKVSHAVASS